VNIKPSPIRSLLVAYARFVHQRGYTALHLWVDPADANTDYVFRGCHHNRASPPMSLEALTSYYKGTFCNYQVSPYQWDGALPDPPPMFGAASNGSDIKRDALGSSFHAMRSMIAQLRAMQAKLNTACAPCTLVVSLAPLVALGRDPEPPIENGWHPLLAYDALVHHVELDFSKASGLAAQSSAQLRRLLDMHDVAPALAELAATPVATPTAAQHHYLYELVTASGNNYAFVCATRLPHMSDVAGAVLRVSDRNRDDLERFFKSNATYATCNWEFALRKTTGGLCFARVLDVAALYAYAMLVRQP
jgi:hypothetical protein